MLEEVLRDENTHPAEAASAMLSFIRMELPAGGAAAEARFLRIFGVLCERVFGALGDAKEKFHYKSGGWLSHEVYWGRPPNLSSPSARNLGDKISANAPHLGRSVSLMESDPVFLLLVANSCTSSTEPAPATLISAISKESELRPNVAFQFPFLALPQHLQEAWVMLLEAWMGAPIKPVTCSENSQRIITHLLHRRPDDQKDLIVYRQRKAQKQEQQPIQMTPRGLSMSVSPKAQPSPRAQEEEEPNPSVMLSMLEYYLFLFIRYPTAAPTPKLTPILRNSRSYVVPRKDPYGDLLYFELFKRMLRFFLPFEQEEDRSLEFNESAKKSELFLRVVIALWLEAHAQLTPTAKVAATIQERFRRAGYSEGELDLNRSYDLAQGTYDPPAAQVQKCFRTVILRMLGDHVTTDKVLDATTGGRRWCLSNAMTATLQPFYNFVRMTFRHASIHRTESPFFPTMRMWLLWLEPWNVKRGESKESSTMRATERMMGSSKSRAVDVRVAIPKYHEASKYDHAWEPYIAANIYLYIVPFAIFVRRARELDFSAGKFDQSIQIVKSVFRVFSPPVIDAINRILCGQTHHSHLVQQHTNILGPFAPPNGIVTLASLQSDMQTLLEEIYMQHIKKVRELGIMGRLVGKIEGFFGLGVVSGEEKQYETLVEKAKMIVGFPVDFDIDLGKSYSQSSQPTLVGAEGNDPPRAADGTLTTDGRMQIILGTAKCENSSVVYLGDPMRARPNSHEPKLLVDLTIWLSDWLNMKLGLIKPHQKQLSLQGSIRINLRFLADYRNFLFCLACLYLLLKWLL